MAQTRLSFHSFETGVCDARIHQGVSQSQSNNEEERRCVAWTLGWVGGGDKANKVNQTEENATNGGVMAAVMLNKYCRNLYDMTRVIL